MDPQDAEETINIGGIAFVILLLYSLGVIAPYLGIMGQCSDTFFLARPVCVTTETWNVITGIDLFAPKICDSAEITPNIRNQAVSIVEESDIVNVGQMIEIFEWINDNIRYVSDPSSQEYFATGDETLQTGAGDCDDQAILTTGMINSVGGISKLVIAPECNHAFSAVYVTNDEGYLSEVMSNIEEIYRTDYDIQIGSISYYVDELGYWIIADPAGGNYFGDILTECENQELEPICD